MTNQPQNTCKNQFSHPGKMVYRAPKLEQFRPNLKLQQICQNWKTPAISKVSAQFRVRFQFCSSSFVPNYPNWTESLLFQGLASLEVFRKKTPSPYGRECPYGATLPGRGFCACLFHLSQQPNRRSPWKKPINPFCSVSIWAQPPDGRSQTNMDAS